MIILCGAILRLATLLYYTLNSYSPPFLLLSNVSYRAAPRDNQHSGAPRLCRATDGNTAVLRRPAES
jgi:hypothetical protein